MRYLDEVAFDLHYNFFFRMESSCPMKSVFNSFGEFCQKYVAHQAREDAVLVAAMATLNLFDLKRLLRDVENLYL